MKNTSSAQAILDADPFRLEGFKNGGANCLNQLKKEA